MEKSFREDSDVDEGMSERPDEETETTRSGFCQQTPSFAEFAPHYHIDVSAL